MASVSNLSPMPQFQPQSDPTNTGARWTAWLERFETYKIAAGVTRGTQASFIAIPGGTRSI